MPLRLWKEKRTLGPTCFFDRCLLFFLDDDGFSTTVQSRPRIRWMVSIIFPHICGPPQWGPLKGHLETRMDPGVSVIRFNSFVLFIRRGLLVKFLWFFKLISCPGSSSSYRPENSLHTFSNQDTWHNLKAPWTNWGYFWKLSADDAAFY